MKSNIFNELNIDLNKKQVISFVGAGGKTTALYTLSKEISKRKKKTLISTTTKIFIPEKVDYDHLFFKDIGNETYIANSSISIIGEEIAGGKLIGPSKEKLETIISRNKFDFYLIEADGANHKPIKAPNSYEPVVLNSTTKTIGLLGLDALGGRISEISHRPEILASLLHKKTSQTITSEDIVKLVLHKSGLFKRSQGEVVLLLNKANTGQRIKSAKHIRESLHKLNFKKTIIADLLTGHFY